MSNYSGASCTNAYNLRFFYKSEIAFNTSIRWTTHYVRIVSKQLGYLRVRIHAMLLRVHTRRREFDEI